MRGNIAETISDCDIRATNYVVAKNTTLAESMILLQNYKFIKYLPVIILTTIIRYTIEYIESILSVVNMTQKSIKC